jgi:hypothetical protein
MTRTKLPEPPLDLKDSTKSRWDRYPHAGGAPPAPGLRITSLRRSRRAHRPSQAPPRIGLAPVRRFGPKQGR